MSQPTLLLVDSYHASRWALAELLRGCGYSVLEAHNGVEALQLARRHPPQLVVVDLWPFFSASVQMVERLAAAPGDEAVPVLVLTSPVTPPHRTRALATGCAGFLQKPCPPEEVLAEIQRILAARGLRGRIAVADSPN